MRCVATLVWLCWTPLRALRQRALLALLLLWIGAGTLGAWAFASAGPCYRTASDPDAAALIARLDASQSAFIARREPARRLGGVRRGVSGSRSAACRRCPACTSALAVLVAIILWQRSRGLGLVLWGYAVVMQIGSVILGWHYAIDGYAGALCAWGAWGRGRVAWI